MRRDESERMQNASPARPRVAWQFDVALLRPGDTMVPRTVTFSYPSGLTREGAAVDLTFRVLAPAPASGACENTGTRSDTQTKP